MQAQSIPGFTPQNFDYRTQGITEARKGPVHEVRDSFREVTQDSQECVETALRRVMAGETTPGVQYADSAGQVKHLALMISEKYVQGEMRDQVLNAYKTLWTHMEPDTKFTMVAATPKDKADLEKVIKDNNIANPERIQIIQPPLESLTVWARDMMIPKFMPNDPDHVALIAQEPLHNWHLDDSQVPARIAEANPNILLETEKAMITDGGDVVSNTKESFVGYYSLSATENKLHENLGTSPLKTEVIHWYEGQTGKHVVESDPKTTFPFKFEPAVAMDGTKITRMVENPDYKPARVAANEVSDAQMFDDLAVGLFHSELGKPVTVLGRDIPATPHIEEPATDHVDMGCTPMDDKTFAVGDPGLANKLLGLPTNARNRDNQQDFDSYAQTLTAKGYNVVRLPHLEPKENGAPYLSYNNCLMERFQRSDGEDVRRVFLPQYGIDVLDSAATKIWESQGFEVIPMQLDKLSSNWGALRCISNWLERSAADQLPTS